MTTKSCESFEDFVSLVATETSMAVERLVQCNAPNADIERNQFRGETQDAISCLDCVTGERATIESGVTMARVNLKMAYEGPDACLLTAMVQQQLFSRISRWSGPGDADIACLRKRPVNGFDLSFIFTADQLECEVLAFLTGFLLVLRQLSKRLRLGQLVEHRRSGRHLFAKLLAAVPKPQQAGITQGDTETELPNSVAEDVASMWTECDDFGILEDVEELIQADAPDSQFMLI
jgi:hypothetical protein